MAMEILNINYMLMTFLFLLLVIKDCSAVFPNEPSLQLFKVKAAKDISAYITHESVQSGSPYWDDPENRRRFPSEEFTIKDFELAYTPECVYENKPCSREYYRRIDGSCNNEDMLGSSDDVLDRLLQPVYDFGVMRMKSVFGHLLPNPRVISKAMKLLTKRASVTDINIFWLLLGQFIDHDFLRIPNASENGKVKCDDCDSWQIHSSCAPILVPLDDDTIPPFNTEGKRKCISFSRSTAIPSKYDNQPAFDQINVNTAFLDLSTVYGSDECRENNLRLFHNGLMNELNIHSSSHGMPPILSETVNECRSFNNKCPLTGDHRSIEQLGIMIFHILFLREHNRLASNLSKLNKQWDDERLYQEARRINIAQYQRIVYEDYLPILVGKPIMDKYGLNISPQSSYYYGYDKSTNPQVLNEFAAVAFRMGHTMIPDHFVRMNEFYFPTGSYALDKIFRNSSFIFETHFVENLARGMIGSRIEAVDGVIQSSLTDRLFIRNSNPFTSADLVSINIARARDHGIPGYAAYRKVCGLKPINSWGDMTLPVEDINVLKKIYSSVEDIDLFVGGVIEVPRDGSLVGPTFTCIIAKQFLRSRNGDKFWFENVGAGFSIDQLRALKEGSAIRRLLAFNTEDIGRLPINPFNLPDKRRNPLIFTKFVKDLNINLWRDDKSQPDQNCYFKGKVVFPNSSVFISPCLRCICIPEDAEISCFEVHEMCGQGLNDEACKLVCGSYSKYI